MGNIAGNRACFDWMATKAINEWLLCDDVYTSAKNVVIFMSRAITCLRIGIFVVLHTKKKEEEEEKDSTYS